MKRFRSHCLFASAVVLLLALSACSGSRYPESTGQVPNAPEFASPSDLTARFVQPAHIDLTWKNHATADGGTWVEFTNPGSDYVKLDLLWPDTTTYRHPDLAPETKYIYRIVPFFGRPSNVASATTGAAPPEGAPNRDEEGPLPDSGTKAPSGPQKSVRSLATFADAVPADLTATLASPTSIDVRWKDRSSDEDGFLVEVSADNQHFQVCALLPPDCTSFKKTQLPPETKCYFRARAFFYGKPSSEASFVTPAETRPTALSQPAKAQ